MKLPGVGEVKDQYVYIGVGVSVIGVIWWRRKNQAAAAAAAASSVQSSSDPNAIDPTAIDSSTGSGGYGGYGGIDPSTGVPYIYESGGTGTHNTSGITTDSQWSQQAEGDLVSTFGYSLAVAQSAVTKYLSQSSKGLNDNEYEAISVIIAELGPPPSGTFRLIHAPSTPAPGGDHLPVLKTGIEIRVPYNVQPGQLGIVASRFGISTAHILGLPENSERGLTGKEKVMEVYYIPYRTQPTDTLAIVAMKFGISPEHLAQYVPAS